MTRKEEVGGPKAAPFGPPNFPKVGGQKKVGGPAYPASMVIPTLKTMTINLSLRTRRLSLMKVIIVGRFATCPSNSSFCLFLLKNAMQLLFDFFVQPTSLKLSDMRTFKDVIKI
jgi:hypothetical protein